MQPNTWRGVVRVSLIAFGLYVSASCVSDLTRPPTLGRGDMLGCGHWLSATARREDNRGARNPSDATACEDFGGVSLRGESSDGAGGG